MVWAKVVLTGGVFLLFAGFAFGTENQMSTAATGQNYDCGAPISPSWLLPGTPDQTLNPGPGATTEERRDAAACSPAIHRSRVIVSTTMGLGGLLVLIGGTAVRELESKAQPVPATLDAAGEYVPSERWGF